MTALFDLADRDPAAAFADVSRTYSGRAVEEVEATLAAYLLEKDFQTVAETFRLVTQPLARQSAMINAVPRVFQRDHTGTLATIREKLSGNEQSYALWRVVLTQLEDHEWREAIQTQLSIPEKHFRYQAIMNVALKVALVDLDLALKWREQLAGEDQKHAHSNILQVLSEIGDDVGLARLLAVTPAKDDVRPGGYTSWDREHLIVRIAWLRQNRGDKAGIADLQKGLSEAEMELVDAVVISADETIPAAMRMAEVAKFKSGHARSNAISRVVALEWKKDPEPTKRLVLDLPDATFGGAFAAMAGQWEDKAALSEWIKALAAGPKRERAVAVFVMSLRWSRKESEQALAREVATWPASLEAREGLKRELRH